MKRVISGGGAAILTVLVSWTLSGCGRNRADIGYWEGERARVELVQDLRLAEYRLNQSSIGLVPEYEALKVSVSGLGMRSMKLAKQIAELAEENRELEIRNDEFVQLAIRRQRTEMVGKGFEKLALRDGKSLQNVLVTGVDDGGVEVRHEDGAAKLRYSDLLPEQQVLFALEEESALSAERLERRNAADYERWIDGELLALQRKEANREFETVAENTIRSPRSFPLSTSAGARLRPLSQPATRVGGRSRNIYSTYRTYRPTYSHVHYYPVAPRSYGTAGSRGTAGTGNGTWSTRTCPNSVSTNSSQP